MFFLFAHSFGLLKSFNQASKIQWAPTVCSYRLRIWAAWGWVRMQVLLWGNLIGEQTADVCLGSPSHLPSLLSGPSAHSHQTSSQARQGPPRVLPALGPSSQHCYTLWIASVSPKSSLVGGPPRGQRPSQRPPRGLLSFHLATVLAHDSYFKSVCGKNS